MSSRRGGALPSVLRGMGLSTETTTPASASESACCTLCKARLEIETDQFTQLIERCPSRSCPNHRWRRSVPSAELIAEKPKRARSARSGPASERAIARRSEP